MISPKSRCSPPWRRTRLRCPTSCERAYSIRPLHFCGGSRLCTRGSSSLTASRDVSSRQWSRYSLAAISKAPHRASAQHRNVVMASAAQTRRSLPRSCLMHSPRRTTTRWPHASRSRCLRTSIARWHSWQRRSPLSRLVPRPKECWPLVLTRERAWAPPARSLHRRAHRARGTLAKSLPKTTRPSVLSQPLPSQLPPQRL
mmetsp:Transcript_34117/g.89707  ORF Transcript_34117/g.89707 Transcript_34117/m.89707 type:complete len:200 (+) Transcript_34117:479-1078(+)